MLPTPARANHPTRGPAKLQALLDSFSTAISLLWPLQSHAIVFLLLLAILKMRNKRIFNEPPRRACVCFV